MSPDQFRAAAEADGYDVIDNSFAPNTVNEDHTHPFDARLLITGGEITVTVDDKQTTCRTGDTFDLAANVVHSEIVGGGRRTVSRRPPRRLLTCWLPWRPAQKDRF